MCNEHKQFQYVSAQAWLCCKLWNKQMLTLTMNRFGWRVQQGQLPELNEVQEMNA